MRETRYPAILRYVTETPWAMLPSTLLAMREIIAFRLAGGRLSPDEVAEAIGARKAAPVQPRGGSVAVLPLWGALTPHTVMDVSGGAGTTALDSWLARFEELDADDSVAHIVLDVDSPGGSVDLVPETAAKIRAARTPVTAVANTRAASAAYWLASQASELVVTPSGAVGSIGVYAAHEDLSRADESAGITTTLISAEASPYKTEGNPFEPLSDSARAEIQRKVDAYMGMFLDGVAQGRGMDAGRVAASFGQGRMLLAADAVNVGMADRVATLEQVVQGLLGGSGGRVRPAARAQLAAEDQFAVDVAALAADYGVSAYKSYSTTGNAQVTLAGGVLELFPTASEAAAPPIVAGPVPVQSTEVVDEPWNGPGEVAKLNSPVTKARGFGMFAWFDPAGADPDDDGGYPDAKDDWKFPHHMVGPDGEPHAANVNGCRNGLARLTDAHIPEADKAGVRAHLQRHIDDFDKRSTAGAASSGATTTSKEGTMYVSPEELASRRDEIVERMNELNTEATARAFTAEEQSEFDALDEERQDIEAALANIRTRQERLALATKTGRGVVHIDEPKGPRGGVYSNADTHSRLPENVFDLSGYRSLASSIEELPVLYREGARRANEHALFESDDADRARGHVERLLAKDTKDGSFARRVLHTASPLYDRAFGKMTLGRPLSTQEEGAIKAAISDTGLGSETPIPVTIDPTVMLTSDGATNPLRAIARTVTITGNKWRGITSDGVTVAYEAELSEVADQTPAYVAPDVEVVKAHGYVEFSVEVDADWGALRTNLASAFQDAKDVTEANKFLLGSGTNEPEGLITALVADGSSIVQTAGTAALALTDLDLLVNDLPPRFDANAQWIGSRSVYSKIRELANANGNNNYWIPLAQGIRQRPSGNTGYSMLDYPINVASDMSKLPTTAGEKILVLGDFGKGFVIVDRVGMNVELIPLVMGANQRPTGARALYVYFRNMSSLQAPNAFRLLEVL